MNVISAGLDKTATDAANAAQNRSAAAMVCRGAADDTGLHYAAGRSRSFNLVWRRLRRAGKVGMKSPTARTRSRGSMAVTYKPLSDGDWRGSGR